MADEFPGDAETMGVEKIAKSAEERRAVEVAKVIPQ